MLVLPGGWTVEQHVQIAHIRSAPPASCELPTLHKWCSLEWCVQSCVRVRLYLCVGLMHRSIEWWLVEAASPTITTISTPDCVSSALSADSDWISLLNIQTPRSSLRVPTQVRCGVDSGFETPLELWLRVELGNWLITQFQLRGGTKFELSGCEGCCHHPPEEETYSTRSCGLLRHEDRRRNDN